MNMIIWKKKSKIILTDKYVSYKLRKLIVKYLKKSLIYMKNKFVDSNGNIYLTVDSSI